MSTSNVGPCCRGMYALRKVFPIRRTVVSTKISVLIFQKYHKKVPKKQGECTFSKERPKSFQGPMVGPGLWPVKAHLICVTPLHYVGKFSQK